MEVVTIAKGQLRIRILGDDSDLQEKLEGSISELGKWGAAAGAAGAAALGVGFANGLNIEDANAKMSAQLGLTGAESEKAGEIAGDLYAAAYGDSIDEVSAAVSAVMGSIQGMAEASKADIESVSAAALNFAETFDIDVNRAAQVAGNAISHGLAPDATTAFDLMTKAAQSVPPALREDVLDAVEEYGGFFKTLGFDGPQAFGLLVDGAAKGQFGIDKAGDAIKEFTIRSTDMSAASKDAFELIGLDAGQMANAIVSGGDSAQFAFQKIVEGLLGIDDPAQRANAAIALFGTPIEDLNVSEIPEFLRSLLQADGGLQGFAGSAEQMGETLNNTRRTRITEFQRSITGFLTDLANSPGAIGTAAAAIGGFGMAMEPVAPLATGAAVLLKDAFVPALSGIGRGIASAGSAIGGAIAAGARWVVAKTVQAEQVAFQWTVRAAGAVIQAAASIGAAIGRIIARGAVLVAQTAVQAAKYVAQWVVMAVQGAIRGAIQIGTAIAGMIAQGAIWIATHVAQAAVFVAQWALMGVQALLHAAKVALAWLIAMGPIILVAAAVIGLVALIIANWDKIVRVTRGMWILVTDFFKRLRDNVVSFVRNLVIKTAARIIDLRDRIVSAVRRIRDRFVEGFRSLRDGAVRWATNLVNWVKGLPGKILRGIGNVGRALWNKGRDLIQGFINGIKNTAGRIITTIKDFVTDAIPGFVKRALGISSPSKVMMALGEDTVMGLQAGLNSMTPTVPLPVMPNLSRMDLPGLSAMANTIARHQLELANTPPISIDKLPSVGDAADRPIEVRVDLDGREVARTIVDPMARELYARERRGSRVLPS